MNVRLHALLAAASLALPLRAAHAQLAFRPQARLARAADAAPAPPPVAAGGYCVVSLRDGREWRSGTPPFGVQFDGRHYFFAGERELEIFAAAPSVYAPVLSGDCIVTYAETGQRVAGRVEFG